MRLHHTVFCLFLSSLYAICNCHSMCHQRWHGDSMNVEHCWVCSDLFETFWWKITCDYNVKQHSRIAAVSSTSTCVGRSHTHTHSFLPPLSAVLANSITASPSLVLCLPQTTAACSKALWGAQVNSCQSFRPHKNAPCKQNNPAGSFCVQQAYLPRMTFPVHLNFKSLCTTHESLNVSLRNIPIVPD